MRTVRIEVEPLEDAASVVSLFGEHDIQTAPELRRRLQEAGVRGPVIVDLERAEFIDSSILGVLVNAARDAAASSRGFSLCVPEGTAASVRRVLEVTGIDGALPVATSRERALELAGES